MESWEDYREVLRQKEICTFCSITSMKTSNDDKKMEKNRSFRSFLVLIIFSQDNTLNLRIIKS